MAAVTNGQELSDLKQHKRIISQFWRSNVGPGLLAQVKMAAGWFLLGAPREKLLSCPFRFLESPEFPLLQSWQWRLSLCLIVSL